MQCHQYPNRVPIAFPTFSLLGIIVSSKVLLSGMAGKPKHISLP